MGSLRVGTSGYHYAHWAGSFYPPRLPRTGWLGFYSRVFTSLELNSTFYRLPGPEAVDAWREQTPEGFAFAAKGSRFLTHMKRLTDVDLGVHRYFERLSRLGPKLEVVLWQLPPQMSRVDPERLAMFLAFLPQGPRHAVEFRHPAWYHEEVCAVLEAYGAAFCEHDALALAPPRLTGGFRYLRFHGAQARYAGRYGKRALRPVAAQLLEWRRHRRRAYVFFNNDLHGHAIADALALLEILGEQPAAEEAPVSP